MWSRAGRQGMGGRMGGCAPSDCSDMVGECEGSGESIFMDDILEEIMGEARSLTHLNGSSEEWMLYTSATHQPSSRTARNPGYIRESACQPLSRTTQLTPAGECGGRGKPGGDGVHAILMWRERGKPRARCGGADSFRAGVAVNS